MKIYILLAIVANTSMFNGTVVEGDTAAFKSAEECYKRKEVLETELKKDYEYIFTSCKEKELK